MKLIHEQEWVARTNYVEFTDASGAIVGHADIYAHGGERDGQALIKAISALPDMARALVLAEGLVNAIQQGHKVDEDFLERVHATINAALRKVKVLP